MLILTVYLGGMLFSTMCYIFLTRVLPINFAKATLFSEYDGDGWSRERRIKESRKWLMKKVYWFPMMLVWFVVLWVPLFLLLGLGIKGAFICLARIGNKDGAFKRVVYRLAGFTE